MSNMASRLWATMIAAISGIFADRPAKAPRTQEDHDALLRAEQRRLARGRKRLGVDEDGNIIVKGKKPKKGA